MGVLLQFVFGTLVLRVNVGYYMLTWIGDRVDEFLQYSEAGAEFVFGSSYKDHFFAMSVSASVTFFSAAMAVMYYFGIAQVVIRKVAAILRFVIGSSPAESVVASANVFIAMVSSLTNSRTSNV
jgi:nucleoside permease NupC